MSETTTQLKAHRRDMIVAASCGVFVAMMVGMAYAAVPLYDWFCRATGFGGKPQIATSAPQGALGRTITVRFDANVLERAAVALRAGAEFRSGAHRRRRHGQLPA